MLKNGFLLTHWFDISPLPTYACLTTDMTFFADVVRLIEAVWAAFDTQLGAFQLQQRRGTCPARLGPRSCTQLTGLVTFMTLGALPVIPEEMHKKWVKTFPSCLSNM